MRKVEGIFKAVPSVDGAGVKLRRVFGYNERKTFDPFLLLDHFGSDNPADYIAGFPWHPHRGIETVTYLLAGKVEHGDSMGNKGTIGPGDAQWMTAGSGIIHQEMPEPGTDGKRMEGFQLWVNLPSELKMTTPRYRAVEAAEVPRIRKEGCEIAVLAGNYEGTAGATPDLFVPVLYLIVTMSAGSELSLPVPASHNAAVYLFRGKAAIGGDMLGAGELAHLPAVETPPASTEGSDHVHILADPIEGASLLFIAGQPLKQPIAWGGPIVMNTRQELERAFAEFNEGTFIKNQAVGN
ncbi:MAG TPA: pirin family protein [Rectinemataceae bacterium]|nr:pirin family protein [Rectinemataceae bacterium]